MKKIIDIGDETKIYYDNESLSKAEADRLLIYCQDSVPWQQDYYKKILVPRLTAFFATKGLTYKYSGLTKESEGMDSEIESLMNQVAIPAKTEFNSCLLNYYRDGNDSIGLHSDSEKELGDNPVVAAMSLGGTRRFDLVHGKKQFDSFPIELEHGSLIIMGPNCQKRWRHKIDKQPGAKLRISLTFRKIIL